MTKLSDFMYKYLKIIYVVMMGCIILLSFRKSILLSLVFCSIAMGLMLLINKVNINKKIVIIVFAIGVLARIALLFFDYYPYQSDELAFFTDASSLASSNALATPRYVAMFPYLFAYTKIISIPIQLFGANCYSVIGLNIIVDLIGAGFAYLCGKELGSNNHLKLLTIWLINPLNIFWCSKCLPVIAVNTCFIVCIYLLLLALKLKGYKGVLLGFLLGILLGIANCFRPIFIIFMIASVIYFCYLSLKDKGYKKYILLFIVMVIPYLAVGNLYNILVTKYTHYKVSMSAGWSIYVGSNIDNSGQWFADEEYGNLLAADDYDANKVQEYYKQKAINNYKSFSLPQLAKLFGLKYNVLAPGTHIYTHKIFVESVSNSTKIINFGIRAFLYTFWFIMIVGGLIDIKKNAHNELFFLMLLVVGLLLAHLLVEVSPRYFMPTVVPLQMILCLHWNSNQRKKKLR